MFMDGVYGGDAVDSDNDDGGGCVNGSGHSAQSVAGEYQVMIHVTSWMMFMVVRVVMAEIF